ncbi:hypothetical protein GDO81_002582 [Engystomops pustulosus]|uniref:Uncharacterized protein n=1 Tax=Engystomops pustulosus TaxID=76066 RepID=A0AAV7DLF3_ENGPU|nr:hypothetical protein GDO81_002582 [Engystomops pustulosus]
MQNTHCHIYTHTPYIKRAYKHDIQCAFPNIYKISIRIHGPPYRPYTKQIHSIPIKICKIYEMYTVTHIPTPYIKGKSHHVHIVITVSNIYKIFMRIHSGPCHTYTQAMCA